jgi:class 3 adenylate cyclase
MSYFVRFNAVITVCLFSIISVYAAANSDYLSESVPSLRSIVINGNSVILVPEAPIERNKFFSRNIVLSHRENNIVFEISQSDGYEFQYFLKGFDREFTDWKHSNFKEYTNLPSGHYIFFARFMDPDNENGELTVLTLRVLPFWYYSLPAIILYLILFSLVIWTLYEQVDLRFSHKQYKLEQIIYKRTEDMIIEKEKSETLLANVLPKNTASEIIEKGKATKIKYDFVTVLFSDIQGFSRIAEEMNPEVLIDELDKFFFHFDSVVEKFRIEKIKTIGDAYMCAGGIPEKNRTNPVEVILAALEMKVFMKKVKDNAVVEGMKYWDIRMGIHTGTVVAGVVGQKKLSYDIWGDTVNIASRMESSGEAGKINISGVTYELVKEFFICEYRGSMPVKYKGEMEMYFVNGIVPDLCDDNGIPDKKFIVKMQLLKLQDIEEMIIRMFDDEASPDLYFHNSSVVKNISSKVELLSRAEKLSDEEFVDLKLASVFLFTGYISDYEKPMEASLRLVEEILPRYGFNQENVMLTCKIIRNSFSNHQHSLPDRILHDARYDYLGRVDYLKLTEKLLMERIANGKHSDTKSWIETQKKLLSDHEFLTNTAKLLRDVSLEEQIAALQSNNE